MAERNFGQPDSDDGAPGGDTWSDGIDRADESLDDLIDRARQHGADPDEARPRPHGLSGHAGRLVERWVPAAVAASASQPGKRSRRRLAALAIATAVVAALLTGTVLATSGPVTRRPSLAPALPPVSASSAAVPSTSTSKPPEKVVVSVVGKVAEPGLVTLPAGSRVADALRAAGGLLEQADRRTVNLARRLVDGEQLYVGVPVPAGATQPASGLPGGSSSARQTVNLNTAGADELETLPGVGDVTARRIIEWRRAHGGFSSVEQLRQVDGIGDQTLADLRDLVKVR